MTATERPNRVPLVGLTLFGVLLLSAPFVGRGVARGAARGEEPGTPQEHGEAAKGGDCLRCHESLRAVLELPTTHEPASEGRCADCHSPHAARYEHLLNKRERALCFSCHEEEKLAFMTGNVHTPILEGQCAGCHEAHGSEHAGLLKAEGNELCFSCHTEKQAETQLPTRHEPFVDGECAGCHLPHNSPHADQLIAPANRLCVVCHDVKDDAIVEAHAGIPVEKAGCVTCHDPHASAGSSLLREFAHAPFADGDCSMCHLVDSETPQLTMATGARLCRVCHRDYPRSDQPIVHEPIAKGTCDGCHTPHASEVAGLLIDEPRATCLRCHPEIEARAKSSRSVHPQSVENGSCTICHEPHASREENLLKAGEIRTCLPCHEGQRHGHPLGTGRIDPRTGKPISCVTCHDPHGTGFGMQLRGDQTRGLCLECHGEEDQGAGRDARR